MVPRPSRGLVRGSAPTTVSGDDRPWRRTRGLVRGGGAGCAARRGPPWWPPSPRPAARRGVGPPPRGRPLRRPAASRPAAVPAALPRPRTRPRSALRAPPGGPLPLPRCPTSFLSFGTVESKVKSRCAISTIILQFPQCVKSVICDFKFLKFKISSVAGSKRQKTQYGMARGKNSIDRGSVLLPGGRRATGAGAALTPKTSPLNGTGTPPRGRPYTGDEGHSSQRR